MRALKMPAESMSPGLEVGDYFMTRLVSDRSYANHRGDILAFYYPGDNRTIHAKRVVGFPGELVEFRNGRLFIDGDVIDAEWAQYPTHNPSAAGQHFGPYEVPDASLFVVGDNLANSADSRVWGPVPRSNLIGVAQYIYSSKDSGRIGMDLRVQGD
jgi:signal peptidase I